MAASIEQIEEHIAVLTDFEQSYRGYIGALQSNEIVPQPWLQEQRAWLMRRAPRARRAIDAAGVAVTMHPPPMYGGPVLTDLVSQIMAHETHTYGSGPDPFATARTVLDGTNAALGCLEDKLAEAKQAAAAQTTSRFPSHRGDRAAPRRRSVSTDASARPSDLRWPTLVGRMRHVPRWLGIVADIGGAVAVVAFLGRSLGAW